MVSKYLVREWESGLLGDHVDSCLGKMLDQKKNKGEFYPYLGNKTVRWGSFNLDNLQEMRFEEREYERYSLKYGDLVICEGGEPGRCAIWKDEVPNMRIQKALHRVRTKKSLNNVYLYYWFLWSGQNDLLEAYFTGTTIKHLTGKALKLIELPIPPLNIQKDIADILSSLDDKIELNRQINETLESMAQALFKSWFVDFDPVIDNALAAGNTIPDVFAERAKQRAAIKASATQNDADNYQQLFPAEFEFTEDMGWIPLGWKISSIGSEVTTVGGATPSTKNEDFWEGGNIHWTTPKDLSGLQSKILLNTARKVTELGLKKISSGLLPVDTVLMSSRAPVGYLALAKIPVAVNQGYIAMKCDKVITPEFAIQWANATMDEIKQRAGGTTFAEISKKSFREIPIFVPDKVVVQAFTKTAKGLYLKVAHLESEKHSLSNLRDTLLPKLLSGELRIPDAEKLAQQATQSKVN